MFGPMLADGFYIRHAKNIEINNVEIAVFKEDARPAFVLDDVQGADFFRIKAPHPSGVPTFTLHNVEDFSIARSKPIADTEIQHVDHKDL